MRRLGSVTAATVLGLAGLTACGGGNGYSSGTAPSAAPSPSGGAAAKLATATVGSFGKIVVDGNGRTVYVFDKDANGKSNCEGGCLTKWPAVAAGDGTPQVDGVEASLVGTITRSDGTKQLTLAGHPLYLFAKDGKGETDGQGFGGIWWVVDANGQKITTQPSSSGNGNNNGY
jgi:predicted lipoprotein with Yx(FWY)xxD motif